MQQSSHPKPIRSGSQTHIAAFNSSLSRRDFLKQSATATLLAGLLIYKPSFAKELSTSVSTKDFTSHQKATLESVQLQLFPDDGDGPSASNIHAYRYLQWALTDPENMADGDKGFIIEGIQWLDNLSKQQHSSNFITLNPKQKHQLLEVFSHTSKHENWMSLLVYYLLEALLLDPVYGGNPNGIGWKWLEHQPGFPRPDNKHTYRHFLYDQDSGKSV